MIRLRTCVVVPAPQQACFDMARSIELHQASAGLIDGRAVAGRTRGLAQLGDRTTWSARFFGLRFRLATEITLFEPPHRFHDTLTEGLFAHFGHAYTFQALGPARTLLADNFFFQSPLGLLGGAVDLLALRPVMRNVAQSRADYLRQAAESGEWKSLIGHA